MKLLSIVLLLLSISASYITVYAQNQEIIDSLETLLKTNLSDKEKVDVWNELAGQLATTDSNSVAEYTQKSIYLSQKINYPEGEARAYHSLGWIIMVKGYYKQANLFFEKEFEIANKGNDRMHKGRALLGLGVVSMDQGKFEESLEYLKKSSKEFKAINAQQQIANTYANIGIVKSRQGKYDEARNYYFKALEIQLDSKVKNDKKNATAYNNIGITYDSQGNYQKSIEYYLKALRLNEQVGNKKDMSANLNNIGIIYYVQEDYEKALEYFFQSSKTEEEINHKWGLAIAYGNLSLTYNKLNDQQEALSFAFKALRIDEELGDTYRIITDYLNISEIYIQSKQFGKALDYVEKGLKLSKEIGAELEATKCYLDLGIIYYHLMEYTKAKTYLNDAILLATKIGISKEIKDAYETLSKVEKELGNFKEAYEFHVLFKEISDSLFNEKKTKQIASLEIQYETEKKDQEIFSLNQETEIKDLQVQRRNLYLIGSGILGLLLVGFGIIFFHQTQLKNRQKTTELEQRLLRSQMNPHFIFNSLIAIQNYIYQNKAQEAGRFLAKFAQLMRAILEGSRYEYIPLEEEVKLLENYLNLQRLRFEDKFTYEIEVDKELSLDEVVVPPMLAQPFLENAIEHGFKNLVQEGKLMVRFLSTNDKNILLEIEDNGIGLNQTLTIKEGQKTKKISRATQITRERLTLLNKKQSKNLSLVVKDLSETQTNTQGTLVSLAIPLKYA